MIDNKPELESTLEGLVLDTAALHEQHVAQVLSNIETSMKEILNELVGHTVEDADQKVVKDLSDAFVEYLPERKFDIACEQVGDAYEVKINEIK